MNQFHRFLSPFAFAIGLSACGGSGTGGLVADAGVPLPPTDASLDVTIATEAGACSSGDPSCADVDVEADAGQGATEASVADAGCADHGPIPMAGDYAGPDGSGYWLRQTATATTFTEVPAGMPVPSTLPRLFRITSVCSAWLVLESTDGAFGRLDWATVDGGLGLCVRAAASSDAANALPSPDPGDLATGCTGSPWIALTKVTP